MQTTVEWLIDQMFKQGYFDGNKPLSITNLDHLQHQAMEMEKQQIIDAYDKGESSVYGSCGEIFKDGDSEKYYNETYKNKINLVEIPREQLEKERNPNYKYFNINETTSQLPGINVNDVKPSNPQMVKENFSTKNKNI